MHRPAQDPSDPASPTATLDTLAQRLRGRRLVVLTGAGCSTESGIPDYRGEGTAARARRPLRIAEFLADPQARARFWARSTAAWARFAGAQPNAGHRALAQLERSGRLVGLITQNVDRLHHAAGSRAVVELHGTVHEVLCLACQRVLPRERVQAQVLALNPGFLPDVQALNPDGDAELPEAALRGFLPPACEGCGGVLKPHVVMFGDSVPAPRVALAMTWVEQAEALLVLGSSLTVYSGYRFPRRAAQRGVPVYIINRGPTRADALAALRVDAPLGEALPWLVGAL